MTKSIDDVPKEVSDKLVKMLGLAYKGGNQQEMEAAMSHAVRYAVRHQIEHFIKDGKLVVKGLSESDIGVAPPMKEGFNTVDYRTAKGKGRRPPCNKYLVWILMSHFNVSVIYSGSVVSFVGRKSDTAFALYAYKFLHHAFTNIWRKYKRETGASMNERNSCFYGIWDGLDKRLTSEAAESEREELAKISSEYKTEAGAVDDSFRLAVVAEKDERKKFLNSEHPVLKSVDSTAGPISSYGAVRYGREAGKKLHINVPLEGDQKGVLK